MKLLQVFDEADMLLVGSFQNKVIRLINLLRFEEKLLSRSKESPERLMELEADPSSQLTLQDESDIETETISEGEGEGEGEESYDDDVDSNNIQEKTEYSSRRVKDWRRAQKRYERSKQYIFVAATLPVNGKKTAGAVLRKMFPDASWVSGKYLHCHSPRYCPSWSYSLVKFNRGFFQMGQNFVKIEISCAPADPFSEIHLS